MCAERKKDKARHIYELQEAANQNDPMAPRIEELFRSQAATIAARSRTNEERHRREWAELTRRYLERTADVKARAIDAEVRARNAVRSEYRTAWEQTQQRELTELRSFETLEERLSGRLHARQDAAEIAAVAEARAQREEELARNRGGFMAERADLRLRQTMDEAATRAAWDTHRKRREEAWEPLRREPGATPDQPGSLSREEARKARLVEEFKRRTEQRKAERNRDRGFDLDR